MPLSLFTSGLSFGGPLITGGLGPHPVANVAMLNPFEVDLQTYLAGALAVPLYPGDHVGQNLTLPSYTYFKVSEEPYYTLKSAAGLTAANYQFDCWATTSLQVVTMERALRALLHGFRGFMGTTPVTSSRLQNSFDLPYEPNVDGSDTGTYHRMAEYRFIHREAIPVFG